MRPITTEKKPTAGLMLEAAPVKMAPALGAAGLELGWLVSRTDEVLAPEVLEDFPADSTEAMAGVVELLPPAQPVVRRPLLAPIYRTNEGSASEIRNEVVNHAMGQDRRKGNLLQKKDSFLTYFENCRPGNDVIIRDAII